MPVPKRENLANFSYLAKDIYIYFVNSKLMAFLQKLYETHTVNIFCVTI